MRSLVRIKRLSIQSSGRQELGKKKIISCLPQRRPEGQPLVLPGQPACGILAELQEGGFGNVKFALVFVLAGIGLLVLPLALTQVSTPPTPQAMPAPTPTQAETPNQAQTATPSAAGQPADAIPRRYVDLWNTGNFDNIQSIFIYPAVVVSHGNRVMLKPEMLKRVIVAWRKAMPDLNFKIEDTIIQGDEVAMRLSFTGSYKERLFANTAAPTTDNPKTIHATEMLMFHLKNGRINQIWEEYDELRMRTLMGGFWRSNEELEKGATASARSSKPAPVETEPAAAPSKP
jgi:predicted ester cyclase